MRFFSLLALLLFISNTSLFAQSTKATLTASYTVPAGVPVFIDLPEEVQRKPQGGWMVTSASSGKQYPAQQDGNQLVWVLDQALDEGETVDYQVEASEKVQDQQVICERHDGVIDVSVRGRKVFQYREAIVEPPVGMNARYRRSGYLHPVWTPSGKVVTGDFAEDHPHQHGVFFAWTNTKFQERAVNFWDQVKGQGRIEHREVVSTTSGPVFGELVVKLAHIDLTSGKPIDVLEEVWRLRVYNTPTDSPTGFLIDFQSEQTCVAESPLKIQQYHYGGMAIRGNTKWLGVENGDFLTSEGMTRTEGNHSRPVWCDLHGKLEGVEAGLTMIAATSNFRSPQPVRLHPAKPYFCWAPLVEGPFDIAPNETYKSAFRFWVHDGAVVLEKVNQLQQNYEARLTAK